MKLRTDVEFNYIIKGHPLSKMNGIPCRINKFENCMSYFQFQRGYIPVILDREINKACGLRDNRAFIKGKFLINRIVGES